VDLFAGHVSAQWSFIDNGYDVQQTSVQSLENYIAYYDSPVIVNGLRFTNPYLSVTTDYKYLIVSQEYGEIHTIRLERLWNPTGQYNRVSSVAGQYNCIYHRYDWDDSCSYGWEWNGGANRWDSYGPGSSSTTHTILKSMFARPTDVEWIGGSFYVTEAGRWGH